MFGVWSDEEVEEEEEEVKSTGRSNTEGFSIAALMQERRSVGDLAGTKGLSDPSANFAEKPTSFSPPPRQAGRRCGKFSGPPPVVSRKAAGGSKSSSCEELAGVECHLETRELWEKFHSLGTEMIITKTGRRMFPTVRCSFSGLVASEHYSVVMDVVPCDNKRYRYAYHRSSWLVAGKADPPPPYRLYPHPDSPYSGEQLQNQVVSFEKVKLTNNELDKTGQIVLNSMHKFQPRIHLVLTRKANKNLTDLGREKVKTFEFPENAFTAVTAYQNQLITKLKIDSNPFAKGFRDNARLLEFERENMESFYEQTHQIRFARAHQLLPSRTSSPNPDPPPPSTSLAPNPLPLLPLLALQAIRHLQHQRQQTPFHHQPTQQQQQFHLWTQWIQLHQHLAVHKALTSPNVAYMAEDRRRRCGGGNRFSPYDDEPGKTSL